MTDHSFMIDAEPSVRVNASRRIYRRKDLCRLVEPQAVAVIGASSNPNSFGQRTLANLHRYSGRVYAVNPRYRGDINGVRCFPSVRDLPETPDVAVLAVGVDSVPGILEECAQHGVGGALVYASGLAESGTADGTAAQQRIAAIGRASGMRIVGPNCLGLVNTRQGAGLIFIPSFAQMKLVPGPVSIVSQSGGFGYTLMQGMERGIGIGHYLSPGNSADVDVCDFIAYLADDPEVKVIVCLFEGVQDGARFLEAAELARSCGKPLIVYKAGTGEGARKAALSHTGTLVGARDAYTAAFERAGVIALDRLDGLLETANFLARSGEPRTGKGVGVLSTSGGSAVVLADKAEEHGVPLPPLANETAEKLRAILPGFGAIANPADLTAEVLRTRETFVNCLDAFAGDLSFDAVVVPFVLAGPDTTGVRAPMVAEVARDTGVPIVGVWLSEWLSAPGSEVLAADSNASLFHSSDHCFAAISHWHRWHARRRNVGADSSPRLSDRLAMKNAQAVLNALPSEAGCLDEVRSKQILAAYGIGILKEHLASTPGEAIQVAEAIGYPVALKIVSPDIAHKTEVGGVELNLCDSTTLCAGFERLTTNVKRHKPNAHIDGVLVQQMLNGGLELVLGARIDPQFGPLVAVGFGGILVEILRDTVVRLAPVGMSEAGEMLSSLRGYPLLQGYRGQPAADVVALAQAIVRFSEFVADNAALLEEVDVNPLIVSGSRCICVDALIVRRRL
jgi:acyl-CoA synthetase (NDP forming)